MQKTDLKERIVLLVVIFRHKIAMQVTSITVYIKLSIMHDQQHLNIASCTFTE